MNKIKSITINALATGLVGIGIALLLIGVDFDTSGAVVFAFGCAATAVGIVGIFIAGVVSLINI